MDSRITGYHQTFEQNSTTALSHTVDTVKPETFEPHLVRGVSIKPPFPEPMQQAIFGMGCFWGAEKIFWSRPGIYVTAVGYSGGTVPQPDYPQVCQGDSGHAEVVLVVFDPDHISFHKLLTLFWENHDPTQGNRQGNDIGSQYRSVIYTFDDQQRQLAIQSRQDYTKVLEHANYPGITTEIKAAGEFFYAESYHQQYLIKNPQGYCVHTSTGIRCPHTARPFTPNSGDPIAP
ncbi:MAG TPA: peptide-methionine (S)-S-oxide reductase MsrA [Gammaproteobacteria bacterium]|mgnify:CR=1 FL=1|nr:peptide-methionine (S)-S-oxide reductase MsrA [Gammaproteobacteria bacterium]